MFFYLKKWENLLLHFFTTIFLLKNCFYVSNNTIGFRKECKTLLGQEGKFFQTAISPES